MSDGHLIIHGSGLADVPGVIFGLKELDTLVGGQTVYVVYMYI